VEYVTLPRTDLRVSRIALGCEPLGGVDWGAVDAELARRAVARALELGVNVFDTANVYGLGKSEENLADALGPRRHNVVIVTKGGMTWQSDPGAGRARIALDGSPANMMATVEGSLRRLRIDCIPVFLLHYPDPGVPVAATIEALCRCREAGKIRHIGLSNCSVSDIEAADRVERLAAVELRYSLLERGIEEGVLPWCCKADIGVLAYGPLAQGLLTGKYARGSTFGTDDRRRRLPHFQGEGLERGLQVVQGLRQVGQRNGKSPAQVALRWVLDSPGVTSAVVGAKTADQMDENVGALDWTLEGADREWLSQSGVDGT
jgi:aryl-alcohol dehydrogenase-like predicted oxidoreductase